MTAVYYLDNSAVFKRYRTEPGTGTLDQLFSDASPGESFYTSFLTVLEFTAAVMRLVRGRVLSEEVAREFLKRFKEDQQRLFQIWRLDNSVVASAVDVAERRMLRAGDAIHLATALAVFSAFPSTEPVLVSSDHELLARQ